MKVFATTAIQDIMPEAPTYVPRFIQLAEKDRFGLHQLVRDPSEADIILFLDGHQHYGDVTMRAICQHPLVTKYREKAFIYSELDQPWCSMPGLYVAMPRNSFNPQRQRACAYLELPNAYVEQAAENQRRPDLLYSFMGRGGNATRERILRHSHPRALIADTSSTDFFGRTGEMEKQKRQYADVIARSKFVLCPRGAGPCSFRIFETMAAGRVPVILSDSWVAPHGPDWENCAVFVKENEVSRTPTIVEGCEERFPRMAEAARRGWEEWFAPDVLFHRMVEQIGDIITKRRTPESVLRHKFDARLLRLRARAAKANLRQIAQPCLDSVRARILKRTAAVSPSRQ